MRKDNHPISIMVIEDNPGDFLLIDDYLLEKFSAIKVTQIKSYQEAKVGLSNVETPDVILLDLVLPDGSGEKLVSKLQKRSTGIPIIILTGYSDIDMARKLLAKGVTDFLIKDEINPEVLYKAIVYAIERKGYIARLKQNKKVYQDLFNFSPQPMWIYDPQNLAFLDVNQAALIKYGFSFDEFMKMTIMDIRPKEHVDHLKKSLKNRDVRGSNYYAGIFVHRLKSGEEISVEIFSSDIEYKGRSVLLVLSNDVTEKHNYISTIENQNDRLRKIAWTQSHVVRAPLARLLSIIHMLELDCAEKEELPALLEQIKASGDELDHIIQKIVEETNTTMNLNNFEHGKNHYTGR
ncbi:MAG: response regulator [Muricauda sp.]|nr:response regulator [Allomuricauda sp.]MBA4746880.1 response regulator [Allomuricauda sp.]